MKSIFLIILMTMLYNALSAQHVAIANDRMNVAYVGISNPLTIVVEGYNPNLVSASTDNGTLINNGDGRYDYTPAKQGKAAIKVSVKASGGVREIGSKMYRIKLLPLPTVKIHGKSAHRFISLNAIDGISASIDHFDIEVYFEIVNFKIDILKGHQIVFTQANYGGKFSKTIMDKIETMKSGDEIHIYEIHCNAPDKKVVMLDDVMETILLK